MCWITIGNGEGAFDTVKFLQEKGFISICDKLAEETAFQAFGCFGPCYMRIVVLLIETEPFFRFFT